MERLDNISQVGEIVQASAKKPQLIFKHSTRCSISAAAKHRLESNLQSLQAKMDVHFLDLLAHRDISSIVADRFGVRHESPQVLLIDHGQATLHLSHYDIEPAKIIQATASQEQRKGGGSHW